MKSAAHRRRRPVRVGLFALTVLLAVAVGAPAGATARTTTYRWSLTGSLRSDWSQTSTEPCGAVGPGSVTSTFKGKPHGSFKVGRNRYGPFFDFDPSVPVRGSLTASDSTVSNPPEPGDIPCRPPDKSGCKTVKLKSATIDLDQGITAPKVWVIGGSNFLNSLLEVEPSVCNHGLITDFVSFGTGKQRYLKPKLQKKLLAGKSFKVSVPDARTVKEGDSSFSVSSRTRRQVTLEFDRR